jgi:hypothetical protein
MSDFSEFGSLLNWLVGVPACCSHTSKCCDAVYVRVLIYKISALVKLKVGGNLWNSLILDSFLHYSHIAWIYTCTFSA